MKRRQFLAGSTIFAANSMLFPREGFAGHSALWKDQAISETQLNGLLRGWLDAFNADTPSAYRAFIAEYLPDGLPYLDDDLAVRAGDGGMIDLEIVSETPAQQIRARPELNLPRARCARINNQPRHNSVFPSGSGWFLSKRTWGCPSQTCIVGVNT